MGNREVNDKKRALETLSDLSGDMTLSQLREVFTEAISNYEDSTVREEKEVIKTYTDSYLFRRVKNEFGNDKLEILRIETIQKEGYSDNYEKIYEGTGKRIVFSDRLTFINEDIGRITLTKEILDTFKPIVKEDFDMLLEKHRRISEQLGAIINMPFKNII